jgi:hypothetical protein
MTLNFNSKDYWENRYKNNGNSGDGSYNFLAEFKSQIINDFIVKNNIHSIIDYGVGDGNQLKLINTENKNYIGIDISPTIISKCKEIFKEDKSKTFLLDTELSNSNSNITAELVLSCDVIYHLIEEDVFTIYMNNLFTMSNKYVIIYAKNENICHCVHVKFRNFTNYIEKYFNYYKLIKYIPNKYPNINLKEDNSKTSPSDFYIFENMLNQNKLCNLWEHYIEQKLLPLINVKLEGNIYSKHHSKEQYSNLQPKRYNIINLIHYLNPKKILEIGFNAGFSSLLMSMTDLNKDLNKEITCIDINQHSYVIPCFEQIKTDYPNIKLITETSLIALPKLINNNETYDIIHIDGDHRIEGATQDFELCLKLSHNKTIIIFDDTNLPHLNDLCNTFIENNKIEEFFLPNFIKCNEYAHRFFTVKNTKEMPKEISKEIPMYVSLTSIFQNQDILLLTIKSILCQTFLPDRIFLYLSEEPYLQDVGFKNKLITNKNLLDILNNNKIIINWVNNEGPYRKLLPLLKEKWNEDCIIITIDDDVIYDNNLLENMINDYNNHKCVINYRGFTPNLKEENDLNNFNYNDKNKLINKYIYNFPTGNSGILYNPKFFHKTKDLIFNKDIYMNTCKTQDDVWFYLIRIKNNIECYLDTKNYKIKDNNNSYSLFYNYNSKDDANTKAFLQLLKITT